MTKKENELLVEIKTALIGLDGRDGLVSRFGKLEDKTSDMYSQLLLINNVVDKKISEHVKKGHNKKRENFKIGLMLSSTAAAVFAVLKGLIK